MLDLGGQGCWELGAVALEVGRGRQGRVVQNCFLYIFKNLTILKKKIIDTLFLLGLRVQVGWRVVSR